ncbi:MAG TPA: hypothetical protein VN428_06560 [Bryobacteraceae bacterium]|nr:hypothetical protein [Bryobacteraceae bacterium]
MSHPFADRIAWITQAFPAVAPAITLACTPPPPPGNPPAETKVLAARAGVVAQYDSLAEAIRRRDLAGIMAVQDSAFTSVGVRGEFSDYAAAREYSRRLVTSFDSVYHIANKIRRFELRGSTGDTAVADVCQELSRLQRVGGGDPRRVDTSALQTEIWVQRHPGVWRRLRVENVHGTRWFVAGKRVDATKPYDPDAPPYEPAGEAPTGCGLR